MARLEQFSLYGNNAAKLKNLGETIYNRMKNISTAGFHLQPAIFLLHIAKH